MSAIVDYTYYTSVYMGSDADQASFPALYAHASRMIAAMTRWQVTEDNFAELHPLIQNDTGGGGFTVGKVTVHAKQSSSSGGSGAMSASISPTTLLYLEQTGLMNPAVPVVGGGHLC